MQNRQTLWIFPILTQVMFSVISAVIGGFSLKMLGIVAITATFPAFLLALVCVKFNYHRQHLFPLAFFSGVMGFFYSLILILWDTHAASLSENHSLIEDSLMALLFALAYALAAIMYSLLVLRPFLRKRLAG